MAAEKLEPLTYRQMAVEIEAIGMEKADGLAKSERLKRPAEMLAITRYKIAALRQIWAVLDRLAKVDEGGSKPASPPVAAIPASPPSDDDF